MIDDMTVLMFRPWYPQAHQGHQKQHQIPLSLTRPIDVDGVLRNMAVDICDYAGVVAALPYTASAISKEGATPMYRIQRLLHSSRVLRVFNLSELFVCERTRLLKIAVYAKCQAMYRVPGRAHNCTAYPHAHRWGSRGRRSDLCCTHLPSPDTSFRGTHPPPRGQCLASPCSPT